MMAININMKDFALGKGFGAFFQHVLLHLASWDFLPKIIVCKFVYLQVDWATGILPRASLLRPVSRMLWLTSQFLLSYILNIQKQ